MSKNWYDDRMEIYSLLNWLQNEVHLLDVDTAIRIVEKPYNWDREYAVYQLHSSDDVQADIEFAEFVIQGEIEQKTASQIEQEWNEKQEFGSDISQRKTNPLKVVTDMALDCLDK